MRVELKDIVKRFGTTEVVSHLDLTIGEGEFFFLLGPSGCGKTTTLRTIAGFELPTSGTITFDGRDVTNLPPNKRNIGMVFQNYALWPHLSVFANVAYGLEVRKVPREELETRVTGALATVQMGEYASRMPNQLSGGQQQRVALARALVIKPSLLLLDEPLSNLDAKLRLEMRDELKRIHEQVGITTIYVTHDQKEALSLADRVAVLRLGILEQLGSPRELHKKPANAFVAGFIGETNFIPGTVSATGAVLTVETPAGSVRATSPVIKPGKGEKVLLSLRPEAIDLKGRSGEDDNRWEVVVQRFTYLGEVEQLQLEAKGGVSLKALCVNPAEQALKLGDLLPAYFSPRDVVVLPFAEVGS